MSRNISLVFFKKTKNFLIIHANQLISVEFINSVEKLKSNSNRVKTYKKNLLYKCHINKRVSINISRQPHKIILILAAPRFLPSGNFKSCAITPVRVQLYIIIAVNDVVRPTAV